MNFDDLHELAAAYTLGALDQAEQAEFESHLSACGRCRREVADYSGVVEALADADAMAPPPELRRRVLDAVSRTPQQSSVAAIGAGPTDGTGPANPIGTNGSAGGAVIDLTDARARREERRGGRILLTAAAALLVVVGAVAALRTVVTGDDSYDTVAAAADAETLELQGDLGTVTVVYSPERDEVGVLSTDLPDPGEGKTYELWLVVDDGVTPAGLFAPDDGDVRQVLTVDDVETLGFGITIEPEGGSEQPTGDILLLGTL